jgi:lipoic acid synthetase
MTSENMTKFPQWIRRPWPSGHTFQEVKALLGDLKLHTVCQSAHCPNQAECWGRRTATFMVLGNTCTRHCTYCAVNSGRPDLPDAEEPAKIAEAVRRLGLRHAVLTSVTRDDLPDGGAEHIAACIRAIRVGVPGCTIEVLVQDFNGDVDALNCILDTRPEIFSHNIETVRRLHPKLRDRRFAYDTALAVIAHAAQQGGAGFVKSAFMLGCGESLEEARETLRDLRMAGCEAVSIGQYLQPTPRHHAVAEYVRPEVFASLEQTACTLGFQFAVAGPFVRSSYRSEDLLASTVGRERLAALRKGDTHAG